MLVISTIKLCLKYVVRKKHNILLAFLVGILIGITTIISTYNTTIINYLKNDISNDFFSNTLLVGKMYSEGEEKPSLDEVRNELETHENIIGVFRVTSRYNGLIAEEFSNNYLSGRFDLYAATNLTLPEITKGTNFPDNKGNYMICSERFYPNDMDFSKFTKDNYIKMEEHLGKTISFQYENFETHEKKTIDYKLIGIYENSLTTIDESICYVTESSLFDVYYNQRLGLKDFDINDQTSFYIQVDFYKNVQKVTNDLTDAGFMVMPTAYIDYSIYENLFNNINKVSAILFLTIILLLVFILVRNIKENKKDYKILSFLGFNKSKIYIFHLLNNSLMMLIGYVFSVIISFIIAALIKILVYYKPLIFEKKIIFIDFHLIPIIIIVTFILQFIVSIITVYYSYRKREINEI